MMIPAKRWIRACFVILVALLAAGCSQSPAGASVDQAAGKASTSVSTIAVRPGLRLLTSIAAIAVPVGSNGDVSTASWGFVPGSTF